MQKILRISVLIAIILGWAACGGNTPEGRAKLDIEVQGITSNAAHVTVSCGNKARMFCFDIVPKSVLDDMSVDDLIPKYVSELRAQYEAYASVYAHDLGINTWAEMVAAYAYYEVGSFYYEDLAPGTSYVVWACVIDENFNVLSDIVIKEFCTNFAENACTYQKKAVTLCPKKIYYF